MRGSEMGNTGMHEYTDVSLYRGSLHFFKAVEILFKSEETCPPDSFGFIISHSLELALKAFLLNRGKTEEEIIRMGHNLVIAWNECVELGLQIESDVPRWCEAIDAAYKSPYLFRYARENTGLVVPSQEEMYTSLDRVIDLVGGVLKLDRNGSIVE